MTHDEAREVYERYQEVAKQDQAVPACLTSWQDLPATTRRQLLCVPLHLHLWMQTFNGRTASRVLGAGELFASYLDDAVQRRLHLGDAIRRLVDRWLERGGCDLDDEDAHAIHDLWERETVGRNWRQDMSPLELLATEGILQKRVRDDGGGYRVAFQQLREYMLFTRMLDEDPTLSLETAQRWASGFVDADRFPECAGALAFQFRRWVRDQRAGDVAGFLAVEGIDGAVQEHLVRALSERLETSQGEEREACVNFLLCVLRTLPAETVEGRRVSLWYLWRLEGTLENWAHLAEREELLSTVAERLRSAYASDDTLALARDRLVAYGRLGEIHRSAGLAMKAREYWVLALQIADHLHLLAPTNADFARDVVVACSCLGDLHRAMGEVQRALEYYQRDLEIAERLHQQVPDSPKYALSVSASWERLGDVCQSRGDIVRARQYYDQSLAIQEDLHRQNPEDTAIAEDLSTSWDKIGDLLLSDREPGWHHC